MEVIQKIGVFETDLNTSYYRKKILKNEPKIIKKYTPVDFYGNFSDGSTGLGPESLTARYFNCKLLTWFGTKSIRKWIRKSYDTYTQSKNFPLYVMCWANVMRKGEKITPHIHSTNPLYLSGNISICTDQKTNTYYDGDPIENTPGRLVLFPSTMVHWTDTYTGDAERITIAFDTCTYYDWKNEIHERAKSHWIRI